jgi:hypothetical protein
MGMGLITLSCNLPVACRIDTKQKVSRDVSRARAVGPVTRVDSKEFASSLRTKSRILSGSASLRTRRLTRQP